MAQQRLQRPDQARLEDLRKIRGESGSPESNSKFENRHDSDDAQREAPSPDGSIEVDDHQEQEEKKDSEESLEGSPSDSPAFRDNEKGLAIRLRPSLDNSNEPDGQDEQEPMLGKSLTVKIRLEGSVDLTTKRGQGKENVGQDLTTRRKEEGEKEGGEKDALRGSRRERSPKPRQVWRPY